MEQLSRLPERHGPDQNDDRDRDEYQAVVFGWAGQYRCPALPTRRFCRPARSSGSA